MPEEYRQQKWPGQKSVSVTLFGVNTLSVYKMKQNVSNSDFHPEVATTTPSKLSLPTLQIRAENEEDVHTSTLNSFLR